LESQCLPLADAPAGSQISDNESGHNKGWEGHGMTLELMPPIRETLRNHGPDEEISPTAEHGMVWEVCWFHSLSWRALGNDASLSAEQQTTVRNLEYLWAADANPALRKGMLSFEWLRGALAEEARLVAKLFPVKRPVKTTKSQRLAPDGRGRGQ